MRDEIIKQLSKEYYHAEPRQDYAIFFKGKRIKFQRANVKTYKSYNVAKARLISFFKLYKSKSHQHTLDTVKEIDKLIEEKVIEIKLLNNDNNSCIDSVIQELEILGVTRQMWSMTQVINALKAKFL